MSLTPSLLAVYESLFSPLAGSFPRMMLDETLTVREADSAACAAGIEAGMCLAPLLSAGESVRHEACLQRSPQTHWQTLQIPQNSALFSLCGLPGYRFLYLEYAYTVRHALIRAVLFPARRDYLNSIAPTERGAVPCIARLRKMTPSRRYDLRSLLRAEEAEEDAALLTDRITAVIAAARCLHTPIPDADCGELFSLTHILDVYRTSVLADLVFIDCDVVLPDLPADAMYVRQEPDRFLLLLSALLSVLNALSEDRCIRIVPEECGADHLIRFSTQYAPLARLLCRTADLQALLPAAPKKQFALTLAEYIIGSSGCEPVLTGDSASGTLTLTLHIPAERRSREFKAPAYERHLLEKSAFVARAFFALPDA